MKKFPFNSMIRKQQPKTVFIEAILSWHLSASASSLASALQKIYFRLQNFFLKNRIFMFFLLLSCGISTTLLQILISLRFPIHPFKGVHWCSRKGYLNIRKHPSIGILKKQLLRKPLHTLHTFQRNIQGGVLFKYTRRRFCNCSKKLFRAAILQTGIYPSNLDVRYSAQKNSIFQLSFGTQS